MRCLFIVEDSPVSPNAPGGAAALYYNHLEMLAGYGAQIGLVVLSKSGSLNEFTRFVEEQPVVWNNVKTTCVTIDLINLTFLSRRRAPFAYLLSAQSNSSALLHVADLLDTRTKSILQQVISMMKPDLIWAEHFAPAILIEQFVQHLPFIYSHHDWLWRIKRYRSNSQVQTLAYRLKFRLKRFAEESLVRKAFACVSASFTEAEEMRQLGAQNVMYLPTTYALIDLPSIPSGPPRIVHLGGMNTTANRLGLKRFLEISWPIICDSVAKKPELWIIGSLEGADEALLKAIREADAVCTGFVQDIRSVLRPYDIHIVPWEHNTGTRTRIPLALNYAQALISTYAAASCLSELINGNACVLVENLTQMGFEIVKLLGDEKRRIALGTQGRHLFQRSFTREALQPQFDKFMKRLEHLL